MDGQQQDEQDGTYRQWTPGLDASVWPHMKLARALVHVNDLDARQALWRNSRPWVARPVIDDDRMGWELRLSVSHQPALLEWSLLAGDAAHALRSALDACVFDFATMDDRKPTSRNDLKFPILPQQNEWPNARTKNLQTVPDAIAHRIWQLQPFQRENPESDLLRLVQWLDNEDKHRVAIRISAEPVTFQHHSRVNFATTDAAARNIEPETVYPGQELRDGTVLLRQTVVDPIETVTGGLEGTIELRLRGPVSQEPVTTILRACIFYVDQVLTYIYGGPPPPAASADERTDDSLPS